MLTIGLWPGKYFEKIFNKEKRLNKAASVVSFLSLLKEFRRSEILVIPTAMLKVAHHAYGVWFILNYKTK